MNDLTTFELSADIVAGTLTSNAKELKNKITEELKNYSVEKYLDKPDFAKSDKALLNKLEKSIAEKRIEITKKWNSPLDDFLSEMKSLEKTISEASGKLNQICKEVENKEKEEKRIKIEEQFKLLDVKVVSLDKIFNPKWLNKSYSMTQILKDLETIIEKIQTELETIKNMQDEDSETLQAFYLDCLDLTATLEKGNQLKKNREIIKESAKQEEVKEEVKENDPIMIYTLRLKGKRSALVQLKEIMNSLDISYEKV